MKNLKDYISESILSSVGAGLEGMANDLKKWFVDGCLKSGAFVTDVNIEKAGERFDIVIPKTEKSLFKKIKDGDFLEITNDFGNHEKYLPMINSIRTENGKFANLSFTGFNMKTTKILPAKCGKYIDFEDMTIDVFDGVPQGVWTIYFNHYNEARVKVKQFVNTHAASLTPSSFVSGKSSLECKLSDFKDCGFDKVGMTTITREISGMSIYPNMFNTKNVYDEDNSIYLTKEASEELNELFENNKWKNGRGITVECVRVWNEPLRRCTTIKFDEERQVYTLTSNWLRWKAED